jgi:hypothetical protein
MHALRLIERLAIAAVLAAAAAALLAASASAALPPADVERGVRALKTAFEHTEGDEGGFDGTLVEQCAAQGETEVRCVVVEASGTAIDFPSGNFVTSRRPFHAAVATVAADGTITTRREELAEPARRLDADIRVADRLRPTRDGRIVVRVSPDVAAQVTVSGLFGRREIAARPATPVRRVTVPGARTTTVALRLTQAQRARIRTALRGPGYLRARLTVRVQGDVGPALATEERIAAVRVVR